MGACFPVWRQRHSAAYGKPIGKKAEDIALDLEFRCCSSVMLEDGKLNLDECFSLCMLCFMSVTVNFLSHLKGSHIRQDSMEPSDLWDDVSNCRCGDRLKTLEQRAKKQHQRCLAHSLVGTPNYIAPEVLLRKGR